MVNGVEQRLSLGKRWGHVAAALGKGILVAGGETERFGFTETTELFAVSSSNTAAFSQGPDMRQPRVNSAGALLGH